MTGSLGMKTTLCACLLAVMAQIALAENFRARLSDQQIFGEITSEDVAAEVQFGRNVAARILGRYSLQEDEALTRYVNLVGRSVAAYSSRPELEFRFAVLASHSVNAYATPGGYIFVTRGALDQMQDEAELAAVLAHEIAHVSERHIVKALNVGAAQADATAGLSRLLGSAAEPTRTAFTQALDKAMALLFDQGLEQKDEFESDRVATELLMLTGYDPGALRRYLDRISEIGRRQTVTHTHPPFADRLHALEAGSAPAGAKAEQQVMLKERFHAAVHKGG